MLQLHLSDRQFYCLLGCALYQRLYGTSIFLLFYCMLVPVIVFFLFLSSLTLLHVDSMYQLFVQEAIEYSYSLIMSWLQILSCANYVLCISSEIVLESMGVNEYTSTLVQAMAWCCWGGSPVVMVSTYVPTKMGPFVRCRYPIRVDFLSSSQIARIMRPTWAAPGAHERH